jgi:hypothetical protein
MTANEPRHTVKDWAIGFLVFSLFVVIVTPIGFGILRTTAPYGWNHILLPAFTICLMLMAWALKRRARRA